MKIPFLLIALAFLTSCAHDSIERSYDFSTPSKSIRDTAVEVTFMGKEWKYSTEKEMRVSTFVGPYMFVVRAIIPEDSDSIIKVSDVKIRYVSGEPIKEINSFELGSLGSGLEWGDGTIHYSFGDNKRLNLLYKPIIASMKITHKTKEASYSIESEFLIEPSFVEKTYNSIVAMFMSV